MPGAGGSHQLGKGGEIKQLLSAVKLKLKWQSLKIAKWVRRWKP